MTFTSSMTGLETLLIATYEKKAPNFVWYRDATAYSQVYKD